MPKRVLVSWSSGKDSAWLLHMLKQQADVEIAGLLTTFDESSRRVSMHAVRRELVEAQAEAAGIPLWPVSIPWPCTNDDYEARMRAAIADAERDGVTHMAFGDLFLEDVRAYRVRMISESKIEPMFPIWSRPEDTPALARTMLREGLRAVLTCVDPQQLSPAFAGREFDASLLVELPPSADPCGERGEFHTFCYDGPMFRRPIPLRRGEIVARDGFVFADVLESALRIDDGAVRNASR